MTNTPHDTTFDLDQHAVDHHTAKPQSYGVGKKTIAAYITGLLLSLLFTATAFLLIGHHAGTPSSRYVLLTLLALGQLFAQVIFFLRINASPEGRWTLMPFLFTVLIVMVLVGGSLWIMYNLNYNMMH